MGCGCGRAKELAAAAAAEGDDAPVLAAAPLKSQVLVVQAPAPAQPTQNGRQMRSRVARLARMRRRGR